ncbi:MAG: hypothetical protein ABIQ18_10740 [Umezawaea sp.]
MDRGDGVLRIDEWLIADVDVAPPRWLWSADILLCRSDPLTVLRRFPGSAAVVYRAGGACIVVIRSGTGCPASA